MVETAKRTPEPTGTARSPDSIGDLLAFELAARDRRCDWPAALDRSTSFADRAAARGGGSGHGVELPHRMGDSPAFPG
jgi:hypothetical protein